MKLQFALLLASLAPVTAALKGGLTAGSKFGQKLLSQARRLDGDVDYSWVANYSIKFDKCHSLIQVAGEEQQNDGGSMVYTMNVVTFNLCPSDTCSSSTKNSGCAQYVVGMDIFVDMYTETKLEEQEAACEYVRENCDCDNANDDDACEAQCYYDAGLDACVEIEGEEAFEVQRYLECAELENNNNNNNNGNYNYGGNNYRYNQYYIGPYCSSNGAEIYMATFYDEGCTSKTTETDIYNVLFGKDLPYSKESIVKNDCISCMEVEEDDGNNNNNGDDANDEDKIIEFCEQLYESSGKCEENIDSQYKDTSACDYINRILPTLEANSKSLSSSSSTSSGKAAKVFAWLFAITTLALGVYAFLLFRKLRRSKVGLADQGVVDNGGEMS